MKFQTALPDLLGALQTVSPAMNMGSTDLTGHFVFRKHLTDPNKVEVLTHESNTQAAASFVGQVVTDGPSFTVPGKALMTILDVLGDEHASDVVVFDFDGTAVVKVYPASCIKKCYPFESKDPQNYKWFDKTLQDAKPVGTLTAERLRAAVVSAKGFVSSEETTNPSHTVIEFQNGQLRATNGKSLIGVVMPGTTGATLRIQLTQHLSKVLAFLGACKTDDVEMLEVSERMYFLRRGDGAVFGWTYYHNSFPKIATPKDTDDFSWKLSSRGLRNAIKAVLAGAYLAPTKVDILAVKFSRPDADGPVILTANTAGKHVAAWEVPCIVASSDTGLPTHGVDFWITQEYLQSLLNAVSGDEIVLGVNQRNKAGYIRVKEVRAGENPAITDTYLFMLAWWKNPDSHA